MKRILSLALAVALFASAPLIAAFALNVDQNRTIPKRLIPLQATNTYRLTVNYNDPNISTAQAFGAIGQNAFIVNVEVEIVTAFNAGSTNVLTIGTSTSANEIVSSSDVDETTPGVTRVTRGFGRSLTASADTTLYAKYTQTGTPATTGQAVIVIEYIPNNDM